VGNFNYLGLNFSRNLSWTDHREKMAMKGFQAMISLCRFMKKVKGEMRFKLGLHLFDAMVVPVLLYGSEIAGFAKTKVEPGQEDKARNRRLWEVRVEEYEKVARRFYKHLLCLPKSAPGTGVELILGRYRLEVMVKMRIMKYWFRLLLTDSSQAKKRTYMYERNLADKGVDCWALSVKNELDRLGFSFVWNDQDFITLERSKQLIKLIKCRIQDLSKNDQLKECSGGKLKTIEDLPRLCRKTDITQLFKAVKAHGLRVNLARLILKCPGGMMEYSDIFGNKCAACNVLLKENVFIHRLYNCPKFLNQRKKHKDKPWFRKGKRIATYHFLNYLVEYKKT
jgi:hypothetical protein